MKKITLFLLAALIHVAGFATLTTLPDPISASSVLLPVGTKGQTITLKELSEISIQEFETLSGRKMKVVDRLSFKLAQRNLRDGIRADGTLSNKKLEKLAKKVRDGDSGFQAGGFFLGLFVGLIGVLIAYLINDEKKKARVKWAWIGWGVWVGIFLIAVIALG